MSRFLSVQERRPVLSLGFAMAVVVQLAFWHHSLEEMTNILMMNADKPDLWLIDPMHSSHSALHPGCFLSWWLLLFLPWRLLKQGFIFDFGHGRVFRRHEDNGRNHPLPENPFSYLCSCCVFHLYNPPPFPSPPPNSSASWNFFPHWLVCRGTPTCLQSVSCVLKEIVEGIQRYTYRGQN